MTALSRLARVQGPRQAVGAAHHRQRRAAARAAARLRGHASAVGRARQRARHGRRHALAGAQRLHRAPRPCASPANTRCAAASSICFAPGMDDAGAARFLRRHAGDDPQLRSGDAAQRRHSCARSIWCRWPNSSSPPRPSAASAPAMSTHFGAADARRSALRGGERGPPPSRHGALAAAVPRPAGDAVRLSAGHRRWRSSRWRKTPRTSASRRSTIITRRASEALQARASAPPYKPLPPERLYLDETEWKARLDGCGAGAADAVRGAGGQARSIDVGARQGRNFAAERAEPGANVFEAVTRARAGAAGGAASASRSRCGARARASA